MGVNSGSFQDLPGFVLRDMVLSFDGLLFFAHMPPSDGLEEVRRTRMANLQERAFGRVVQGERDDILL